MIIWLVNIISVIAIMAILLTNFFLFQSWKKTHFFRQRKTDIFYNKKIYFIVLCGVLISIYLILHTVIVVRFVVNGSTIFEISFIFTFIFLATIIMGPFWAGLIILIGNTVSYFVSPGGPFLLIYAVGQMFASTICWLSICSGQKNQIVRKSDLFLGGLIIVIMLLLFLVVRLSRLQIGGGQHVNLALVAVWITIGFLGVALAAISLENIFRFAKFKQQVLTPLVVKGVSHAHGPQGPKLKRRQKYQIFLSLVVIQTLIYVICSVICDSIGVAFLFSFFNIKNILPTLIILRLILLIPIVIFETIVCFCFLLLLPKSTLHKNIIAYSNLNLR